MNHNDDMSMPTDMQKGKNAVTYTCPMHPEVTSDKPWLIAAMFLLKNVPAQALWNAIISGVIVIALSFPKGRIREKYGTFDRYIF